MAELNARDAKLVQFLNEAHAKEAELEADLTAHVNLTQKAPYKKRLQQHLRETKDHKKRVARRIKELGGSATAGVHALGVPNAAGELAGKAIATVKGQVGMARAVLTEQGETHLRNAREELREEYVEIGTYVAIEAFATEVGDRETAQLAKSIRRDEQKMADYLERLIPQLVKDVVKKEIPRDQRPQAGRRRRSTGTRTRATASRSRATGRKSSTRSPARKTTTRARRATKSTTAASGARSGARAATTSAKRSTTASRGASNGSRTSSNGRSRTSSGRATKAAARS
jgi:ferritin-like metal-binding protein YciE